LTASVAPEEYAERMIHEVPDAAAGAAFDWTPVVSAGIGLFSGLVGAVIGSWTQRKVANDTRRHAASDALWTYQRVLHDQADRLLESAGYGEERAHVGNTSWSDVAEARRSAYVYAQYLPPDKQALITDARVALDDPGDYTSTEAAEDLLERATQLHGVLTVIFKDFSFRGRQVGPKRRRS
jgi:hypothetical protein